VNISFDDSSKHAFSEMLTKGFLNEIADNGSRLCRRGVAKASSNPKTQTYDHHNT
jgi:hypothetical protein